MTTHEKIKKIADILAGNNKSGAFSLSSRFDKKQIQRLREVYSDGFADDECQMFAEETVDELFNVAVSALNNGFDAETCNAINGLMNCVVAMTGSKAYKKLKEYRKDRKEILSRVRISEPDDRIKRHVYGYVDTSVEYIDIQLETWGNNSRTGRYYVEAKDKLLEIRRLAEEALDYNTKSAASYAGKINAVIIKWRKKVDQGTCTPEDVRMLDEALDAARDWNDHVRNDKAASEKEISTYSGVDTAAAVIEVRNLRESVEVYRENLAKREADIAEIGRKADELYDKRTEKEKEISECEEQINKTISKYENGRISKSEANSEVGRLTRKIDSIKEDIEKLDKDRKKLERRMDAKKRRLWLLETVIEKYEENQGVPELLLRCMSVQTFDIGLVLRVVDGTADANVVELVENTMMKFKALDLTVAGRENAVEEFVSDMKEEEKEIEGIIQGERQQETTGKQEEEEIDYIELARKRGIVKGEKIDEVRDEEEEEEQEETRERVHARPFGERER